MAYRPNELIPGFSEVYRENLIETGNTFLGGSGGGRKDGIYNNFNH